MNHPEFRSESLRSAYPEVSSKIDGFKAALDEISADIKELERYVEASGLRTEIELYYWQSPLTCDPNAVLRPDQGRILPTPTAAPKPSSDSELTGGGIYDPGLLRETVAAAWRRIFEHQRMRQVWQRCYAVAWAPVPNGDRWRLWFREYRYEGVAYLDDTGEFLEDETMEGLPELVSTRPLIETPAAVRHQVGTNGILERLLRKLAATVPQYQVPEAQRQLRLL